MRGCASPCPPTAREPPPLGLPMPQQGLLSRPPPVGAGVTDHAGVRSWDFYPPVKCLRPSFTHSSS